MSLCYLKRIGKIMRSEEVAGVDGSLIVQQMLLYCERFMFSSVSSPRCAQR